MTKEKILKISGASLRLGEKQLWKNLNLEVRPGEFIAVIGSNGSGKTALLRSIVGQLPLSSGSIELFGQRGAKGSKQIGYIPQHRQSDAPLPVRAKDLVRMGLDGHRFGLSFSPLAGKKVCNTLAEVGALEFSNQPISQLSGGQLQRVRVAQAVVNSPRLILADEPLSALDLKQQAVIAQLLNEQREKYGAAVIFVTHDVNPILNYIDRILYLANGKFKIGTVDQVLRSEVLSKLYGRAVDVVRNQGRVVVLGSSDHDHHPDERWS